MRPKTKYMLKILSVYRTPRTRRDAKLPGKCKHMKSGRMTEVAFLRRRETQVKRTLQDSTEERSRKLQISHFGTPVPADTHRYETPAIEQVRSQAAKREGKKLAPKPNAIPKLRASSGRMWSGDPVGGQTPTTITKNDAVCVLLPRGHPKHAVLTRRGFRNSVCLAPSCSSRNLLNCVSCNAEPGVRMSVPLVFVYIVIVFVAGYSGVF